MQSKTVKYLLIGFLAVIMLGGAFAGGLLAGWALPINQLTGITATQPSPAATAMPGSASNRDTLMKPFWESWDIVHQQFVDQPVDDVKLMQGAIQGMISSLGDEHSSYMDPDTYQKATENLEGKEYEGIGAWVDITGEYLKIISPMPGSPAEKAGIKTGDVILKVNQEDMTGIAGDIVLKKVLGPAGTIVTLTIQRKNVDEPFDISITRAKIITPQTESKMLDNNVAYIRLYTYGDLTASELKKALNNLLAKKPVGLVLDLRGNGGGYLDTAISVLSEFFKQGTVVMYEQYGDGTKTTLKTKSGGSAYDIPLVVLVDEGSASASEITAGAIQDLGRGKLVGVKTYGKGSVQNWVALKDNQGAVRVTVARWLTPKERQINKLGLMPDVEIKITDADIQAGRDPQLEKAVEILTAK